MSSHAYRETKSRDVVRPNTAVRHTSAATQAKFVQMTKRLFRERLAETSLKMPKVEKAKAFDAFELTMRELLQRFWDIDVALDELLASEKRRLSEISAARQPTLRLKRALAEADKVGRGRFDEPAKLFKSLAQASAD